MSVATTDERQSAASPARRRKRVLLTVLGVLLAFGAVAGAWFVLFASDAEATEDVPLVEGEIVVLEPQTTTLGDAGLNHARVALAVVLAEGVDPAIVAPRAALLQDALLRELATMDADGVRSAQGSDALRERLSVEAQEIWGENEVVRVVLTELLVQ